MLIQYLQRKFFFRYFSICIRTTFVKSVTVLERFSKAISIFQ
jgi:hypothetical protein